MQFTLCLKHKEANRKNLSALIIYSSFTKFKTVILKSVVPYDSKTQHSFEPFLIFSGL